MAQKKKYENAYTYTIIIRFKMKEKIIIFFFMRAEMFILYTYLRKRFSFSSFKFCAI